MLDERILRLRQDVDERVFIEGVQRYDDGQAPDEFRNQTVLQQIFGQDVPQDLTDVPMLMRGDIRSKSELFLAKTRFDDLFDAIERAAADEQDVRRID